MSRVPDEGLNDAVDGATGLPQTTVLVAGNEESMAGEYLEMGFEVLRAQTGRECIETAGRTHPDVILLAPLPSGMNRLEVVNALASDPSTTDLSIVLLSSDEPAEERIRCLEAGALDYVIGPVDPRELRAIVDAAARIRKRIGDLRGLLLEDPITGLPGVKAMQARLAEEVARSRRTGADLALMILDVDGMGAVNEQFGRRVGDMLLAHIAEAMRTTLRTSDTVYRYTEDRFAALLPDIDVSAAGLVAERARDLVRSIRVDTPGISVAIDKPTDVGGHVSASFGVADISYGRSGDELIARAESAMGRAKESGGDRIWRADDPRRRSTNTVSLAQELTQREWDILTQLAHRRTEQEIAKRLGIRGGTVRSHKARIRRKLNIPPNMRLSDFARDHYNELVGSHRDSEGGGEV